MTEDNKSKNDSMSKKLKAAGKKAETATAQKRERVIQGSHLQATLLKSVADAGLTTVENTGFTKVTGNAKGYVVYIAKKGGLVDFSGFTVDSPAVTQITEAEAREKHLGKVRGRLDFTASDEAVLSAFNAALAELAKTIEVAPKPAKVVRVPRTPKAPKVAAATVETTESEETSTPTETAVEASV